MAAFATLLTGWTGNPGCLLNCLCSNRFSPELRDYVGTISQETMIPFTSSPSFLESVARMNSAALAAYKYGRYDSAELNAAMRAAERARGMPCHRDVVVNNTTGHSRADPADRRSGARPGRADLRRARRVRRLPPRRQARLRSRARRPAGHRRRGRRTAGRGRGAHRGRRRRGRRSGGVRPPARWSAGRGGCGPVVLGRSSRRPGGGRPRARPGVARIDADGERLVACLGPEHRPVGGRRRRWPPVVGRETRHGVVAPSDYEPQFIGARLADG